MSMLIREPDNILFREDDIPPISADPETYSALRDLMMITDPMLIQKYNEETLPSVQFMISELNIKESKSTTMAATQESENPTNKKHNRIC